MNFFPLTAIDDGTPVAVNFDTVQSIHPNNNGNGSIIYFDEDNFVCVKESYDEISQMVNYAVRFENYRVRFK